MSEVGEHLKHKTYVERDETVLEHAVDAHWTEGQSLLSHLPKKEGQALSFVPELAGAVFVGHIMTDLDSVAGAIGAAHLYGGDPAIASEINTETEFALKEWGCALPATIETTLEADPRRNVCLVDFQQQSQLNPVIPMSNIVGIIDHHALQSNTIVTEKPIFVDIRPWGCMSSIIAHNFATQEKFLPKPIAGMLLSAILSDTLNLRSPTTTAWDERIVAMLVQYTKVKDVNELAARQFRAKSHSLSLMTPYALVNGDVKRFKFAGENGNTYTVAYSVVETTDAPASLARAAELAPEMRAVKAADASVDAVLLAVVDIVALTSTLVVCGRVEASLATAAYGGVVEDAEGGAAQTLALPGLVSRKKDFVPALTKAVKDGWAPPEAVVQEHEEAQAKTSADDAEKPRSKAGGMKRSRSMKDVAQGDVVVDYSDEPSGKLVRLAS
jgi:inorganic pyrophosphatase/exopolyphosphatase